MVFSSILFLYVFLPIFLILYFVLPKGARNVSLLIASLLFYAWGEPIYIALMLFSTLVDYTLGYLVQKHRENKRKAKVFVICSIVINLSLLGFFKYYDFFATAIFPFLNLPVLNLALPIGISFYTFQSMSYTIDVYRKDGDAQRNFIDFASYVTMFPQLIAGPIVKYKDIAHQLRGRKESVELFGEGVSQFLCGLAKKVLLANNIGLFWDTVKALPQDSTSVVLSWLGIAAFGFQIYFDFSGYSDMALGLGKLFGFHLPQNFNYPYTAKSITDFWRRWHISLSTWFREYVYIPLGGNRKGAFATYRNLLIVWALTGFWHGANFNFLFWGIYFAIILMLEKAFLLDWLKKIPSWACHVYTLLLVAFGWILFAFEDLNAMASYVGTMFGTVPFWNNDTSYYLFNYVIILIVAVIASTPLPLRFLNKLKGERLYQYAKVAACVATLFLATAYLVDSGYNPFLYFRF